MTYIPFNCFYLFCSVFIQLILGCSLLFLLFPTFICKKYENHQFLLIVFTQFGITLTFNSYLGYLLDIFFKINLTIYLIIVLILFISTIILRKTEIKICYGYFKTGMKILIEKGKSFIKVKQNALPLFLLVLIFYSFFINTFNYALTFFSIPYNDSLFSFEKVMLSIESEHITWSIDSGLIGLLNWNDRIYPVGFYINLIFFVLPNQDNGFLIIKFLGPIISTIIFFELIYLMIRITKNLFASLIGIGIWVGVYINMIYANLTLSSIFGLSLSILSVILLLEDEKISDYLSAIISGGGMLMHPFSGGIFMIFSIFLYLIFYRNNFSIKNQSEIVGKDQFNNSKSHSNLRRIFQYLITLIIIILPYILLMKHSDPDFFTNLFKFLPSGSANLFSLSLLSNYFFGLSLGFQLNGDVFYDQLYSFGPYDISYLIIIFCIFGFSRYKKELILFISLALISFLYFINPLVINNIPLKVLLDGIYISVRALWFFSIGIVVLSAIAIDSFQQYVKIFFEKNMFKLKKPTAILISEKLVTLCLIFITINGLRDSFIMNKDVVGSFQKNYVPAEYTESMLWLNNHCLIDEKVIVMNEFWYTDYYADEYLEAFHNSHAYRLNVEINNSFYLYNNTNFSLSDFDSKYYYYYNMEFSKFDYIIVRYDYLAKFEPLIDEYELIEIFRSINDYYIIFQINVNDI